MARVKVKSKSGKKKASKKSGTGKPRVTIIALVVSIFTATPNISSEACVKKVLAKFPDSVFDESHYVFYRNKVQKDPYNVKLPSLKKSKSPAKGKKVKKKSKKKR